MNLRRFPAIWILSVPALVLWGCRPGEGPVQEEAAGENAIEQVKERGPVKVVLRVEPKEPTFAERVQFTINVTAKKGVDVTLPSPGEHLGGFIIKEFDAPPVESTADSTTHLQSYILEFLTSGEYKIPPMTISFQDRRPDVLETPPPELPEIETKDEIPEKDMEPEFRMFKIVTDEIAINVKPLADPGSLQEIAPIEAQAEPPPLPASLVWPLGILGGLAGAGLLAYVLVRFLRRERPPPPPVPPHEIAYRELEWLLGQGFIDRGELKEFFFHLSRILREYIENRFGLRAPELTTEEFLEELARSKRAGMVEGPDGQIPFEHQRYLQEFLERSDLVKFARYLPGQEEIEASFEAAKRFIEATLKSPQREVPYKEEVSHAGRS